MTRPWIYVLVAGCTAMADPKPEPPPNARFEQDMMVRFHMHQNYDLLRAIERLLIKGKLEEARTFAAAIATAPDEPAHGPWATQKLQIRDQASQLSRATDVRDALRKTAAIGGVCGNCHGEQVVKLALDNVPRAPADLPTLDARMARHRWAADRLWEGVIGNSENAWRAGLDVLVATPLEEPADRAGYARELQRQADVARKPSPGKLVDRATAYGNILATCASCHTAKPR
jgi:cytochrome c553